MLGTDHEPGTVLGTRGYRREQSRQKFLPSRNFLSGEEKAINRLTDRGKKWKQQMQLRKSHGLGEQGGPP